MDKYTLIIIVTIILFSILATVVLVPVYRFLKKEETLSELWTPEAIAQESIAQEAIAQELENEQNSAQKPDGNVSSHEAPSTWAVKK